MSLHRYTQRGVENIVKEGTLRTAVMMAVAVSVAFGILFARSTADELTATVIAAVPMIGLGAWVVWSSRAKTAEAVRATTFAVDDDGLTCQNKMGQIVLQFSDVTEVRYMKNGLFVRGRDLKQSVLLRRDLEDADTLIQQVESRLPHDVKRIQSSASLSNLVLAAVVVNTLLLAAALTVTHPGLAAMLCVLESTILIGCVAFTLRQTLLPRSIRLGTALAVLPALSLLYRAWTLVSVS